MRLQQTSTGGQAGAFNGPQLSGYTHYCQQESGGSLCAALWSGTGEGKENVCENGGWIAARVPVAGGGGGGGKGEGKEESRSGRERVREGGREGQIG